MRNIVAVEDGLTDVKQALENAGFKTVNLSQNITNPVAVVVTGMDENFLGMQTVTNEVPVIDCRALTAEQVVEEVQRRIVH
ncbi:Uncharacterised protein family (UPF0180) [Anaerobranca californiensis DSM 14826]|jgi:type III secretory pathway component EscV|uniref:Uncharacterized protein family (UPF0180) n=1 Tax=Anaerobranca californiensis DSM 14826 TaxID=1120989 RepID=A0A1M6M386_9FIRM|nr:YkuS family protein [Anaerobranca californiensis]SHJ77847.1 Uncharacterised protein family (UPF0180) [Anaerobranca californiensis DSM 14826]